MQSAQYAENMFYEYRPSDRRTMVEATPSYCSSNATTPLDSNIYHLPPLNESTSSGVMDFAGSNTHSHSYESTMGYYANDIQQYGECYDEYDSQDYGYVYTGNDATPTSYSLDTALPTTQPGYFDNNSGTFMTTETSYMEPSPPYNTLHQHASAKQRRSRHDPGGGEDPYDHSRTPEVEEAPSPIHYDPTLLPVASTTSSLAGAVVFPVKQAVNQITTVTGEGNSAATTSTTVAPVEPQQQVKERSPSPMAHLPYPEEMGINIARRSVEAEPSASSAPKGSKQKTRTEPVASSSKSKASSSPFPETAKYKRGTPTPVACFFCRKRKIACGGPRPGREDKTCAQCSRRRLECTYPEESHRGRRKP
ncbi:hypothetical protein C8Q75DRAFT_778126 [Abortiporus biennis]|nr:hypothetical protein C8Q75DRAFT_778126 [Abortiporus biennis]